MQYFRYILYSAYFFNYWLKFQFLFKVSLIKASTYQVQSQVQVIIPGQVPAQVCSGYGSAQVCPVYGSDQVLVQAQDPVQSLNSSVYYHVMC